MLLGRISRAELAGTAGLVIETPDVRKEFGGPVKHDGANLWSSLLAMFQ